jgi:hypothetical protein
MAAAFVKVLDFTQRPGLSTYPLGRSSTSDMTDPSILSTKETKLPSSRLLLEGKTRVNMGTRVSKVISVEEPSDKKELSPVRNKRKPRLVEISSDDDWEEKPERKKRRFSPL